MKHNLKKTIRNLFYFIFIVLVSCTEEEKDKIQVLNINTKEILNQFKYYKEGMLDYERSHFYRIYDKNCIEYHSILDTTKVVIGENRFIIFKTSNSIKPDFSNIDSLVLEEFVFLDKQRLCLDSKFSYKYGVIEDVVFLKTDSIINGEKTERIISLKQYVSFKDSTVWNAIEYSTNLNQFWGTIPFKEFENNIMGSSGSKALHQIQYKKW
jgi:hypothetical protein